jgi:hypothetical protein
LPLLRLLCALLAVLCLEEVEKIAPAAGAVPEKRPRPAPRPRVWSFARSHAPGRAHVIDVVLGSDAEAARRTGSAHLIGSHRASSLHLLPLVRVHLERAEGEMLGYKQE